MIIDGKSENLQAKLNVLRAGVLGANDGIISTAGLIVGVAGATTDTTTILVSGLAALVAGALSMAGGEYVSVSTQKDTEKAQIEKEKEELKDDYDGEIKELADLYIEKGLSAHLAKEVAVELMKKDALTAHAEVELNIDPKNYTNPYSAALSSMFSFSIGAVLPLLSILFFAESIRIAGTFLVVLVALSLTGYISAHLGGAKKLRAVLRNVGVGTITMLVTYFVGQMFHI
ncbi:MAG: VIT family protein [Campylobacteraceae bacterium]